jgi:hypothetical protein
MSTSTPKNVPSTTPTGPKGNAGKAGSAKTPKNGGATEAAGSVEAGGSAATSGAAPTPERVYVKLPVAGGGVRVRRETQNALFQWVSTLFAAALCVSVPAAPALIMFLLLIQGDTAKHGLVWLWIAMFVIVEPMALLVAWGVWREFSGWTSARDYAR